MKAKLIYVADDEVKIRELVKTFLVKEGFDVMTFSDGQSIFEQFKNTSPDMLILDISMPVMDGYSVCTAVRKTSNVPIIFVSARDGEPDRIAGLSLGSDDYITKPFSPMELVARVKSIFRRIDFDKTENVNANEIKIEDIVIYPEAKTAELEGVAIELTVMELNLLCYLAKNKNRAVGREELLNRVWGFESEADTRATDDCIKRVRKKLLNAGSKLHIETVWGFGFKISERG